MQWGRAKKNRPWKTGVDGRAPEWATYEQYARQRAPVPGKPRRGLLQRLAAALCILVLLLALRRAPFAFGEQIREGLRYVLTTEWNVQPVMQKVVQLGLQMVNFDRDFNGDLIPRASQTLGTNAASADWRLPVSGRVVRGFGWSVDPLDDLERFHPGVDIAAPAGTPVRAAREGRVEKEGKDGALGRYVLLNHGDGCYTLYAGLAAVKVTAGQKVDGGQELGTVGGAGDVPGGGLHFELREKERLVDPLGRLPLPRAQ